jgi:glycosyltransferase involved in cell wall biosynthesis
MTRRPAVSIITPAYNAGTYLGETIQSVQAQTFRDFEMVVIDDGSTDATAEVATRFAKRDNRIRLIRQSNSGISNARNAAIACSTGPVLALLDSDDIWFPSYLERQLRILQSGPKADVVSANAFNLGGPFDGLPLRRLAPGLHPISLRSLIEVENSVCILSIFRREICDRVGVFDPTLDSSEDYDFWLRAALAGFLIVFNSSPLGLYRRRGQSVSADDGRMLASIIKVLRKTKDALPDRTMPEAEAIDRQLERFEWAAVAAAAKLALYRREFSAAADGFAKLANREASMRLRLAALGARYAPSVLLFAHRTATSLRRMLLASGGSGARAVTLEPALSGSRRGAARRALCS